MTKPLGSITDVLADKHVRDAVRGVIALAIYVFREANGAKTSISVGDAFDRSDRFIDEWIKRSK